MLALLVVFQLVMRSAIDYSSEMVVDVKIALDFTKSGPMKVGHWSVVGSRGQSQF